MIVVKKMVSCFYFLSIFFLILTAKCSFNEEEAIRMWRLNSLSYCDRETLQVIIINLVYFSLYHVKIVVNFEAIFLK